MNAVDLPFVSVIIPTRNAAAYVDVCFESIRALDYPSDRYELIVADAMSGDETREIARRHGAVLLDNAGVIQSAGRHGAFEQAKGTLIAFCDADCVVDAGWLRNAVKYFDDPAVGGVSGPTCVPPGGSAFEHGAGFVFTLAVAAAASVHADKVAQVKAVKDLPGANCIYRREAIGPALPLAALVAISEDVVANWHIRTHGYTLLHVPDVRVWHHKRPTPKRLWRQMYRYGWGRVQISRISRDMLWPAHVIIAAWMPVTIAAVVLLAAVAPHLLLVLAAAAVVGVAGVFIAAWSTMRSVPSALSALVALAVLAVAWPLGFLRELLFPQRAFTQFLRRYRNRP